MFIAIAMNVCLKARDCTPPRQNRARRDPVASESLER